MSQGEFLGVLFVLFDLLGQGKAKDLCGKNSSDSQINLIKLNISWHNFILLSYLMIMYPSCQTVSLCTS